MLDLGTVPLLYLFLRQIEVCRYILRRRAAGCHSFHFEAVRLVLLCVSERSPTNLRGGSSHYRAGRATRHRLDAATSTHMLYSLWSCRAGMIHVTTSGLTFAIDCIRSTPSISSEE